MNRRRSNQQLIAGACGVWQRTLDKLCQRRMVPPAFADGVSRRRFVRVYRLTRKRLHIAAHRIYGSWAVLLRPVNWQERPMMTDGSRAFIIILILLSLQVFTGCMATINPDEYSKHYQDRAELITVDSSKYKLASNWRVDSNYCIRGRGMYVKDDSTRILNVNIPISSIRRLVVEDNITPIYFELIIVSVIFIHML